MEPKVEEKEVVPETTPVVILTLPLVTALYKKLRREAYGSGESEEILSPRKIYAIYDYASYEMSEDLALDTPKSS